MALASCPAFHGKQLGWVGLGDVTAAADAGRRQVGGGVGDLVRIGMALSPGWARII